MSQPNQRRDEESESDEKVASTPMDAFLRTLLIALLAVFGLLTVVALVAAVCVFAGVRRRHEGLDENLAMPNGMGTLVSGQFRISSILLLTAMTALSFAVVRLPVPWTEKITATAALIICFVCWLNRNYLHPRQSAISYEVRRRFAVLDFFGSLILLPLFIWFYASSALKAGRPVWSTDVIFFGAVLMTVAIATWKLVKAHRK